VIVEVFEFLQKAWEGLEEGGYMKQRTDTKREKRQNRKVKVRYQFRTTSSVLRVPLELPPETPAVPGLVGFRFGWTSGVKSGLPPPSETNGATGEEQKNERSKGHPKCRCGIGHKARVAQFPNFMFDEREQGNIDGERNKRDEGCEERRERREQGNRDMGGEREE